MAMAPDDGRFVFLKSGNEADEGVITLAEEGDLVGVWKPGPRGKKLPKGG